MARRWLLLLARLMLKSDYTIDRAGWRAGLYGLAATLTPGRWRNKFAAGGFLTDVIFMLAGTVLGQAASVLLSPALTRLYTPDQLGYLSVYTAALTILGVIAARGFELAIPIAASEAELANLVAASAGALVGTTGLLSLIMWLAPDRLLTQLWVGSLASYRCLLPIGFACVGAYCVTVAAATRVSAFREIAWTRVSQGLSGPISQIALGLLGAGPPGWRSALSSVNRVAPYCCSRVSSWIRPACAQRCPGAASRTWCGATSASRYSQAGPAFSIWPGSGPILFLVFSTCYSSEIAGYMFLTERIIARPLLMVSTSLLQVFTGEAGGRCRPIPPV